MYPMLENGVSIGTFSCKDQDEIHYFAQNAAGEEFEIDRPLYEMLLCVDGTKPLPISAEDLAELELHGLIRTRRLVRSKKGPDRFILSPIGERANRYRPLCRGISALLPVISVLTFAAGVYLRRTYAAPYRYTFSIALFCGLTLLSLFSLVVHEAGHFVACIAAGYNVSEAGILLLGPIPMDTYVAHEENSNVRKRDNLQYTFAGMQANLLFAGLLLIGSVLFPPVYYALIHAANLNVGLALLNLLPIWGLDGEDALGVLLDTEDPSAAAKKCLSDEQEREKYLQNGLKGYLCVGALFFTLLLKIVLLVLLIGNAAFYLGTLLM